MKTNLWTKENIAKFCYTYAIAGGAWLETKPFMTSEGLKTERNWFTAKAIDDILGHGEFSRLFRKHGWMTGCWITID